MGSQFVDLDGDGHTDWLTATFDGSPHAAWGGEGGFSEPEHLVDAQGERVILSYFWDHEREQHLVEGRAMGTDDPTAERLISALAHDQDGDGDRDLLLGSYENGRLYLQENEGTDAEPRWTGSNVPVMAGAAPFALPAKMTAPTLADWDGDGDLDLIAGSFGEGDRETPGEGGGVFLARNVGEAGATRFAALEPLVPPTTDRGHEPTRPDVGLYPTVTDWDGDGDLDLIVGGYSIWTPEGRELTAEEQAEAERLRAALDEADAAALDLRRRWNTALIEATEGMEEDDPAYDATVAEIDARFEDEYDAADDRADGLRASLEELVPSARRKPFVWFYERL